MIYLPDGALNPVGLKDVALGGPSYAIDPNHCESLWCAYAWPAEFGVTGKRAFFVNQTGKVLQTDLMVTQYTGAIASPPYSAAFTAAAMNAPLALPPSIGLDGNTWVPAH